MANTVNVIIKADDQASREIDNVTESTGKLGSVMQGVGTIAAGFLAANVLDAGFRALTDGVNNAIEGWKQHLEVASQTEAAIASTGAAAGLTAQQVEDLANQFKATSLFEDDVIQGGENLLLTFTNIGSDVFPRATQAMLDMSQRMGQDVSTSAIQLGKALNDPIAGVTSLRRVGVQLTDQQQEQIKTMVEAGDVAGAQAVILAELEKEFGGSAKAASDAAGANATLDDRMDDLNDTIGEKLLPVQLKLKEAEVAVIEFILNEAIPAIQQFSEDHKELADNIGQAAGFIQQHWDTIVQVIQFALQPIENTFNGIITATQGLTNVIGGAVAFVDDLIHGRWSQLWGDAGQIVSGMKDLVVGILLTWQFDIEGIVSRIRDIVVGIMQGMSDAVRGVFDGMIGAINGIISRVNGAIGAINSALSFSVSIPGVDLPGPLPDIPGVTISGPGAVIPRVPMLASGGIVRRPTLAMLGEAGPEAVVPLGRGGMGPTVNVYVSGSVMSERDLVRVIRNEFLNGGFGDIFNNFGLGPQGI